MQSCNAGPSPSVSVGPSVPHQRTSLPTSPGLDALFSESNPAGLRPLMNRWARQLQTLDQRLISFLDSYLIHVGFVSCCSPLTSTDRRPRRCDKLLRSGRVEQTRHAHDSLGPRVELLTSVGRNSDVILPSFPLSSSETARCAPTAAFVADQCKSGRGKWALVGQILGFDSLAKRSRTLKNSRGVLNYIE